MTADLILIVPLALIVGLAMWVLVRKLRGGAPAAEEPGDQPDAEVSSDGPPPIRPRSDGPPPGRPR